MKRIIEYQQRAEGGGSLVQLPNDVFTHGEAVLAVPKKELTELLTHSHELLVELLPAIRRFALQDYAKLNDTLLGLERSLKTIKEIG